ncbi:glycosyltransferase [Pedobacter metabolipauper]|uniref:Glycosyl transferase family 2 n=1 Tax=Pedobacter metabolipauper TaxID=425513 RepID=A0A4R6SY11_9SPHI|nr:glycosyltransferase [Pedobacter metabolipauper]TDQ09365.1 glycosyl transferase family 2 [Pedobacter metabolipauper]
MISIIICSADKQMLSDVTRSITETVGIPFEILSFENSGGKNGICSLYNRGARQAKYDLLCFMHEDIDLKTQDWGAIVSDIFENNKGLGVLGLAGCRYKGAAPTGWGIQSYEYQLDRCNYIQSFKYEDLPTYHHLENPNNERLSNVVSVDGMWFCTTKEIVLKCPFDEKLLHSFHGYDQDFCYQVGELFSVNVTFDILIDHYSEGKYDKSWWVDILKVHDKWQRKLPMSLDAISLNDRFLIEKRAYRFIVVHLSEMGYSWGYIFNFLTKQLFTGVSGWQQYLKANLFLFKQITSKPKP